MHEPAALTGCRYCPRRLAMAVEIGVLRARVLRLPQAFRLERGEAAFRRCRSEHGRALARKGDRGSAQIARGGGSGQKRVCLEAVLNMFFSQKISSNSARYIPGSTRVSIFFLKNDGLPGHPSTAKASPGPRCWSAKPWRGGSPAMTTFANDYPSPRRPCRQFVIAGGELHAGTGGLLATVER